MIIDWILTAISAGINALISLGPSITIPTWDATNTNATTIVMTLNGIIPIYALMVSFFAILAVQLLLQIWDLIVFVYHQFWGSD